MQTQKPSSSQQDKENVHALLEVASVPEKGAVLSQGPLSQLSGAQCEDSAAPTFELAVPYGCPPAVIEEALTKFIVQLISRKSMHPVKRLFFVPVGLPGMGKSTLAKHIRQATQHHLSGGKPVQDFAS